MNGELPPPPSGTSEDTHTYHAHDTLLSDPPSPQARDVNAGMSFVELVLGAVATQLWTPELTTSFALVAALLLGSWALWVCGRRDRRSQRTSGSSETSSGRRRAATIMTRVMPFGSPPSRQQPATPFASLTPQVEPAPQFVAGGTSSTSPLYSATCPPSSSEGCDGSSAAPKSLAPSSPGSHQQHSSEPISSTAQSVNKAPERSAVSPNQAASSQRTSARTASASVTAASTAPPASTQPTSTHASCRPPEKRRLVLPRLQVPGDSIPLTAVLKRALPIHAYEPVTILQVRAAF